MKKLLLSVFALTIYVSANAQCTDLFISEYVEGSNNDKSIELYNPTANPISLNNNYRMIRYNNGTGAAAGEANAQASINLGTHVMPPFSTWIIVIDRRDTTQTSGTNIVVSAGLRAIADTFLCSDYLVSYTMNFNGNDALSLQKTTNGGATWNYVDIFGKMGDAAMTTGYGWSDQYPYDGSAGVIWTENHTLVRKASIKQGVTSNPSTFIVTTEWDSLPNNTWTGLGSHTCSCATGINEIDNKISIVIYPNPTDNNIFNVSSSESIEMVEIYNVVGQQVLTQKGNKAIKGMRVETNNLNKGIYFVKVLFANNKTSVAKLTIK